MPDVDKVARQGTRRNKDDVDANVIAGLGKSRDEDFCGGCNAAQAVIVNREIKLGDRTARLDFDKCDDARTARDYVDFARRGSDTHGKDAPAFQSKPCRRKAFGAPPARFGGLSFHALNASARV